MNQSEPCWMEVTVSHGEAVTLPPRALLHKIARQIANSVPNLVFTEDNRCYPAAAAAAGLEDDSVATALQEARDRLDPDSYLKLAAKFAEQQHYLNSMAYILANTASTLTTVVRELPSAESDPATRDHLAYYLNEIAQSLKLFSGLTELDPDPDETPDLAN